VLDAARIEPGATVADVGAGNGLLTLGAVSRVGPDGDVLAFDSSVDALEELRAKTSAPNISYLLGSANVLPLPDESVDAVVTRSLLIYVQDKEEAVREFHRVLRRGGRVSLFEPINLGERQRAWNEAFNADRDDPMLNFDETDLERFFTAAGFADVVVEHGAPHAFVSATKP
jgi:ubiquinone/menaquinone biosynthesis C-methylase UbiE